MSFAAILAQLVGGLGYSVLIFVCTALFSLPLGFLICLGRMSRIRAISAVLRVYISVVRGTPLMLQLFVVYFAPYYLFRILLRDMGDGWLLLAVLIGFVLNYAAYFAEIFRSGLASVPQGQYEAARVLGLSRARTMLHVVLPQVVRRVLPSVTNEMITLVKDTSLAFAIGQVEMFTVAKRLASREVSMLPYAGAALLYYLFNLAVAYGMAALERRLSRYRIR